MKISRDKKSALLYIGRKVPVGWELIGTVQGDGIAQMGALLLTSSGNYVQFNGGGVHPLPKKDVIDGLKRVDSLIGVLEDIARTSAKMSGGE